MTDYETTIIPDVDIEESLHKVLINDVQYFIGKTGNIYHSNRYIIGKIIDWDDDIDISKGEELNVRVKPIIGYKNITKKVRGKKRDKFPLKKRKKSKKSKKT